MSFLDLPRELRDMIYEICIESFTFGLAEEPDTPPKTLDYFASSLYDVLPLAGLCSQIRQEMLYTLARSDVVTFFMEGKDPHELKHLETFLAQFDAKDKALMLSRPIRIRLGGRQKVIEAYHSKGCAKLGAWGSIRPADRTAEAFLLTLGQLRSVEHITFQFYTTYEHNFRGRRTAKTVGWKEWVRFGANEQNIIQTMQPVVNSRTWDIENTGLREIESHAQVTYNLKLRKLRPNEQIFLDILALKTQQGARPTRNLTENGWQRF
ncbi:MAG: hypothetical protein M1820_009601 [Bogoriella megaspora]|nr:MAG: hypothetical protein M1820_009601 [Bogoriella megaspora]